MKRILLVLCLVLIPTLVWAAPFLASDPSTYPIAEVEIQQTVGGVTTTIVGTYIVEGTNAKLLDLAGKTNGSYRFQARWRVAGGLWSDLSLPFDVVKPGAPGNTRIVP